MCILGLFFGPFALRAMKALSAFIWGAKCSLSLSCSSLFVRSANTLMINKYDFFQIKGSGQKSLRSSCVSPPTSTSCWLLTFDKKKFWTSSERSQDSIIFSSMDLMWLKGSKTWEWVTGPCSVWWRESMTIWMLPEILRNKPVFHSQTLMMLHLELVSMSQELDEQFLILSVIWSLKASSLCLIFLSLQINFRKRPLKIYL